MRALGFAPLLALLGAALLGPVPGCGGAAVRRTVESTAESPENVARLRWRTSIHEHNMFEPRAEECAAGVVVGPRLLVGSRAGNVVALGNADGRILWSTPVSGGIDAEARFDGQRGHAYVGSDDGSFYAVSPEGAVKWSYKSKGAIERLPEMDAELVYFTTANDRIVALEAASGKWRWQYERETPEGFTIHGHSGPRLHQGSVYVGFSDGFLVALQAATGQVLWARSLAAATEQFVDVDATPALYGDTVIASSYSGGLYALSERNGDIRWRRGIEGASALRIDDKRLYVAAPREGLAAFTPDGNVLWRQGLADAGDLTPPQSVGPYLVFSGSRAGLFIVDRASGRLLQLFNPGHGACAPATVGPDGHDLYLLANSGTVYALRLTW
jgi:outer membrane protein assembly factor BamB